MPIKRNDSRVDYPFLFVNHGPIDPDYVGKCEELFLWFARPVTVAERKKIQANAPSPINDFLHWDDEFCYFGSQGDTYDASIRFDYAPKHLAADLESKDPAVSTRAWGQIEGHFQASVDAFAADVEQWAHKVHAVAPLVVFWGPHGGGEDDEWATESASEFSEVMYDRLANSQPKSAAGKKYLEFIRGMCSELLVAPAKGGDKKSVERAVATLNAAARKVRPKHRVERLTYEEHDLLALAGQIAEFSVSQRKGLKKKEGERLNLLSPLAQLVYWASYEKGATNGLVASASPSTILAPLVAALADDEKRSAGPLLIMAAEAVAHDTPAFDRPSRRRAGVAAAIMELAVQQKCAGPGGYAHGARYHRWAKNLKAARALLDAGLARFGERPVLVRAAAKLG